MRSAMTLIRLRGWLKFNILRILTKDCEGHYQREGYKTFEYKRFIWVTMWETYLLTCAPNDYSNQPVRPRSLIRVFVVYMKKLCSLCSLKCAQWRFWSDCATAQSDLNLRWAHLSEGTFSDVVAFCRQHSSREVFWGHVKCVNSGQPVHLHSITGAWVFRKRHSKILLLIFLVCLFFVVVFLFCFGFFLFFVVVFFFVLFYFIYFFFFFCFFFFFFFLFLDRIRLSRRFIWNVKPYFL